MWVINKFDEIDYAKQVEENGFLTRFKKHELRLLAKYYKSIGMTKSEIKAKIHEFCAEHIDTYTQVKYHSFVNNTVTYAWKSTNKLIVIDSVGFIQSELDAIDNIGLSDEHKKFVFSMLVSFKITRRIYEIRNEKTHEGIYFSKDAKKQREVFKISMVNDKKHKYNFLIKDLYDNGNIDITENGSLKLVFMEDTVSDDIEEVYHVKTKEYSLSGLHWLKYKGSPKIGSCKECGIIIKKHREKHIYCKDCGKKVNNRKTRKNMKIRYEMTKSKENQD
jgi:hypothetical protein